MSEYAPITILPAEIQRLFRAQLIKATPTERGAFRLVDIRTASQAYEDQRITVLILDEDGQPTPSVPVAFAYSTADFFTVGDDFLWTPPLQRAFVIPTAGSGQIDMVLGSEGVVKDGQAGGVTVFILTPDYSSDYVTGCGMLADHTGLHLTFQRFSTGYVTVEEQLTELRNWVMSFAKQIVTLEDKAAALDSRVADLESRVGFINEMVGEK